MLAVTIPVIDGESNGTRSFVVADWNSVTDHPHCLAVRWAELGNAHPRIVLDQSRLGREGRAAANRSGALFISIGVASILIHETAPFMKQRWWSWVNRSALPRYWTETGSSAPA
jgi:hypothetical protein